MSYRIATGSSLRFAACAAVLVLARPLAAQEPRVIINGGDKIAFGGTFTTPISDETIRSLIASHLPEELKQDEPRSVVLVIDANDQYVSSKASKATVITGDVGGSVIMVGDSTGVGGPVIIRRTTSGNPDASAATGVSFFQTKTGDESSGVFGSGYTMSEISTVGMRRYAAGQLGTSAMMVMVVKLK
jgi:hypothetical protein